VVGGQIALEGPLPWGGEFGSGLQRARGRSDVGVPLRLWRRDLGAVSRYGSVALMHHLEKVGSRVKSGAGVVLSDQVRGHTEGEGEGGSGRRQYDGRRRAGTEKRDPIPPLFRSGDRKKNRKQGLDTRKENTTDALQIAGIEQSVVSVEYRARLKKKQRLRGTTEGGVPVGARTMMVRRTAHDRGIGGG